MVTDVNYLYSVMNDTKSTGLITRDLLGGAGFGGDKELDLDVHVPFGYEKRLDLKSGKVYLQKRCKSPNVSSSSSDHKQQQDSDQTVSKLQDLNFPPSSKKPLNLFDDTSLDLNLVSLSSSSSRSANKSSVCTLDKVKFALERAERAERETISRRSVSVSKSCSSPTSNNSSSSVKETIVEVGNHDDRSNDAYAAGCPSCLLYVLISRGNPRCPRCSTTIAFPETVQTPTSMVMKKPRIDLNYTMMS